MIVKRITLDFFRNYLHLECAFSPATNVIYGENAQGKTNLLEAVAYLSTASSHRARYDRELIQLGVDSAWIQAEVFARAAARRRFLDECICQLRPRYAMALAEYKKLYEHKIRILRDWTEKPSLLDALDEFSLRMAQTGAVLIHYRAHFIRRLQEVVPPIHSDFSGGRERLDLRYETVKTVTDPEAPMRDILSQLLELSLIHI